MKSNIAAIGEQYIVEPLKMIGIDVFPIAGKNVKDVLLDIVQKGYSVVLITEDSIQGIEKLFLKLSLQPTPSLVPIPGKGKSKDFAYRRLRELIKKAVGTDILKEKKDE